MAIMFAAYPAKPVWAGQVLDCFIPGGAQLNKEAFAPGLKVVRSGTLVYRNGDEFGPVLGPLPTAAEVYFVAFDVELQSKPHASIVRQGTFVYESLFWWNFTGSAVPPHLAAAATSPLGVPMTVTMRDVMLALLRSRYQCIPRASRGKY